MIHWTRIRAIIFRHILPTFRDPMRIADMFYWPLVDIVLFGFMATWAQEQMSSDSHFMLALVTCLTAWQLVNRSTLEIGRNLLMEMWDNHLINLFATPLTIAELLIGLMFLGIMQACITFTYSICIVWLFYAQNIFALLPALFPFIVLLIMSGFSIGFLIVAMLFWFGKNLDTLTWATIWFFAVISGAFYPIKFFPVWLQKISYLFPTTYLFEGIRTFIMYNTYPWYYLGVGAALTFVYFFLTFALVNVVFEQSKKRGLSRLE